MHTEVDNFLDESDVHQFWDCTHGPFLSRICLADNCSKTGSRHLGSIISVSVPVRSQELPLLSLFAPVPMKGIFSIFPAAKVLFLNYM